MIIMMDRPRIDESRFASEALLQEWCDGVPLEEIAGDYPADRAARAAGAPVGMDDEPPEVAPA
jgi:hypothetical protein